MSRRSRIAVVVLVALIAAWWGVDHVRALRSGSAPHPHTADRTISQEFRDAIAQVRSHARSARIAGAAAPIGGDVTITGHVIDIRAQRAVGNVEVVFRGGSGETTATAGADGAYAIRIAAGTYRAFVRDDAVLSIGRSDRVRVPGRPSADTSGIPDEALMLLVVATADSDGIDLSVVRGGTVTGRVLDRAGRAIVGAIVRARGTFRPTLATDVAETDRAGGFELRLPAGEFGLDASHPRFAGIAESTMTHVSVQPGDRLQVTLTLTAGCVIAGRVLGRDGKPAADGALERQWGAGDFEFGPSGRIEPDGRFRWTTTDEADVTLRAWPWKSPPSPPRRFTCRDGARFDDIVFRLPDRHPDLEGVLVDKAGDAVGFGFLDLAPLDGGGIAQQERTDALGRWAVYSMPPGRYRVTAQAEGRGVVSTTVVAPRDGIRIELGGTGRLEGTAMRLATGSFELAIGPCHDGAGMIAMPQLRRLVTVTAGRFAVDDLPACALSLDALWRGERTSQQIEIPSGGTAYVELDVGPPRPKTVHGVVRDAAGEAIAGAVVVALEQGHAEASTVATTNAAGAYTIRTFSGASLRVVAHGRSGVARVGGANVDTEQVDVVVDGGDEPDAQTDD